MDYRFLVRENTNGGYWDDCAQGVVINARRKVARPHTGNVTFVEPYPFVSFLECRRATLPSSTVLERHKDQVYIHEGFKDLKKYRY